MESPLAWCVMCELRSRWLSPDFIKRRAILRRLRMADRFGEHGGLIEMRQRVLRATGFVQQQANMIQHRRLEPTVVDFEHDAERLLRVRQRIRQLIQRAIELAEIV